MLYRSSFVWGLFVAICLLGKAAQAETMKKLPDEYETAGGHSAAFSNAGVAAVSSHVAVRINPALLALERQYSMSAGYHWPSTGREFYQASVVDSKTSPVAAGVNYTGYLEDYVYHRDDSQVSYYDSPIIRRGVLGIGHIMGSLAVGVGGVYVESHPLSSSEAYLKGEKRVRGVGLNLGVVSNLTPQFRLGASAENVSNRRINDYAPRTYRAGAAYLFSKTMVLNLDYRQRERVAEFEGETISLDGGVKDEDPLKEPERMVIGALTATFQDVFQITGSYGYSFSDDRREAGGGIGLVQKGFGLFYTISKPYFKQATTHQSVNIKLEMAI